MIDHLKKIGLTELEAKCYLALIESNEQTGYEVAKNISSSRSNVYAALNSLHKKGACQVIEGKSTAYVAVPIDELISKLQLEFKQASKILTDEIKREKQTSFHFYNTQGLEAVQSVIKRSIGHAQESIVVDVFPEDLTYILPLLEEAQERGLEVTLITFKNVETSLKNIVIDAPVVIHDEDFTSFNMLFDQKKAIIGSFDGRLVPSAVETKHPALIQEIKLGIKHDIMIEKIRNDFGEEIEAKYGKNFFNAL